MKPYIKRTALNTLLASLLAAASAVHATDTATSPFALNANVSLVSQYVFRGISYSQERPAMQGGFDLAHGSGLYLGVWGTSVSDDALNDASGEIDVYGGYANTIGDFGYDIGLLQFIFPGGRIDGTREKYDTLELYAGITWKFLSLKYSHTLGDYFGFNDKSFGLGRGDSKGSYYVEANLAHEFLPGWIVSAHVGHQYVRNYGEYNFTDWKIGLEKSFGGGWQAGLAWVDTDADKPLYTVCDDGRHCKNTASGKWLVHLTRSF